MLYVANAGDGSVRSFEGSDYKTTGQIELGSDADNIRVDAAAKGLLRNNLVTFPKRFMFGAMGRLRSP
jgi:hypothetical protein